MKIEIETGKVNDKYVEMITWKDITHQQGQSLDERIKLLEYVSIGVILYEDKYVVEIQDTWCEEDEIGQRDRFANSRLAIPKGVIVERVKFVRKIKGGK